jgi:nicotinamide mononucleotide (NMN) deamidase PncC
VETALEVVVGQLLRERGMKLAAAESCTGGLIGHLLTDVPGASDYYLGSITAYAFEAKRRLLGVRPETLREFGAVSRETALEMARGHRDRRAGRRDDREAGGTDLDWPEHTRRGLGLAIHLAVRPRR